MDFFNQVNFTIINGHTWYLPSESTKYNLYQDYVQTICKFANLDNILNTISSTLDRWSSNKDIIDLCTVQLAAIISNHHELNHFVEDIYKNKLKIYYILQDTIDRWYITSSN